MSCPRKPIQTMSGVTSTCTLPRPTRTTSDSQPRPSKYEFRPKSIFGRTISGGTFEVNSPPQSPPKSPEVVLAPSRKLSSDFDSFVWGHNPPSKIVEDHHEFLHDSSNGTWMAKAQKRLAASNSDSNKDEEQAETGFICQSLVRVNCICKTHPLIPSRHIVSCM